MLFDTLDHAYFGFKPWPLRFHLDHQPFDILKAEILYNLHRSVISGLQVAFNINGPQQGGLGKRFIGIHSIPQSDYIIRIDI
jgi:hypothetical protein